MRQAMSSFVQRVKRLLFVSFFIGWSVFIFVQGVKAGRALENPVVSWSINKLILENLDGEK